MILRKPYAFLIKNFKRIHFILAILIGILIYKTNIVFSFYKNYINFQATSTEGETYLTFFMYILALLIIVINVIIYYLMREKKKPKVMYLISIISYIAIFVGFIYLQMNLHTLSVEGVMDAKSIRMARDIAKISTYVQYILIIPIIIRALGFDVKRFDFAKDIQELDIELSDNEEVELLVGVDTEAIKSKIHKKMRGFKYYYQENRIFILAIGALIAIVIFIIIIVGIRINRVYNEGQTFENFHFKMKIEDSYISAKSSDGTVADKNNKSYVVLKLNVISNHINKTLDTNDFILVVGNKNYAPTKKAYNYFTDIGIGYKAQTIGTTEAKTYILVYDVNNNYLNKKMILRYELKYTENGMTNQKVNIKPTNLDKAKLIGTYNLNDEVTFNNNIISSGKFKINKYALDDSINYNYKEEIDGKEYDRNLIIKGSDYSSILNIDITSSLNNDISNSTLIGNYTEIKYLLDGKEYTSSKKDKTPEFCTNGLFLEVDKQMKDATDIYLDINIRGNEYKYYLKKATK